MADSDACSDHRLGDCCSVYDAAGDGDCLRVVLGIPWRDFCAG